MKHKTKAKVVLIGNDEHNNPRTRKSGKEIDIQSNSSDKSVRFHAYCQPGFCSYFYGGQSRNCDGSVREGYPDTETHSMFVSPTVSNCFKPASMMVAGIDYGVITDEVK